MTSWIKFEVGNEVEVIPTSVEPNMYNGNPSGFAYTCNNGSSFRASDQLHQMIQEFAPNQGIGQAIRISKKTVSNASGRSYQVFTLNGKTLEEHKNGGLTSMPTTPPQQSNGTPQTPAPTTTQAVGNPLEQRVQSLEQRVNALELNKSANDLF